MPKPSGAKPTTTHFHVPIPANTRSAIGELAASDGISSSELARRILSDYVACSGEDSFGSRLDKLEKAILKTAGRVDATIAIVRAFEQDEIERRGKERKIMVEAISSNSRAIETLAANLQGFQSAHDAEIERMQFRLEMLGKLSAALICGISDAKVRRSYRDIEIGMSDGKKLISFLKDALRRDD